MTIAAVPPAVPARPAGSSVAVAPVSAVRAVTSVTGGRGAPAEQASAAPQQAPRDELPPVPTPLSPIAAAVHVMKVPLSRVPEAVAAMKRAMPNEQPMGSLVDTKV